RSPRRRPPRRPRKPRSPRARAVPPPPRRARRRRARRSRRRAAPTPSACPSRRARRSRPAQSLGAPRADGCAVARALFVLELRQHRLGDAERLHRRGHAAVDRRLEQHLLDLLWCAAVANRAAHVDAQLVRAVERGQHSQVDEAALLAAEAGARPDGAPAVLGDELLHRPRELAGLCERALDVRVAEHLATDALALLQTPVVGHSAPPSSGAIPIWRNAVSAARRTWKEAASAAASASRRSIASTMAWISVTDSRGRSGAVSDVARRTATRACRPPRMLRIVALSAPSKSTS